MTRCVQTFDWYCKDFVEKKSPKTMLFCKHYENTVLKVFLFMPVVVLFLSVVPVRSSARAQPWIWTKQYTIPSNVGGVHWIVS